MTLDLLVTNIFCRLQKRTNCKKNVLTFEGNGSLQERERLKECNCHHFRWVELHLFGVKHLPETLLLNRFGSFCILFWPIIFFDNLTCGNCQPQTPSPSHPPHLDGKFDGTKARWTNSLTSLRVASKAEWFQGRISQKRHSSSNPMEFQLWFCWFQRGSKICDGPLLGIIIFWWIEW